VPDYSAVKLGKKPYVHDPRTLALEDYLVAGAPPAPPSLDYSDKYAWQMWLNDRLGCCTCSSSAGETCCWCAVNGVACTITDNDVLVAYEAVSGYDPATGANDNGAVEIDVLKYRQKTGVGGHKIYAYLGISHVNESAVNTAIWMAGSVYIGLQLPLAAQKMQGTWDFPAGTKKTGKWAPGSWGGHAVFVCGYDAATGNRKIITWGEVITVTKSFWDVYIDEVWMIVSPDWMGPKGTAPSGLNVAQLDADLKALQGSTSVLQRLKAAVCGVVGRFTSK
jgi:hypothetical protein